MEFKDLINIRESCRNFSDKDVEIEKIQQIISMSRLSPSATNSQPWSMHVVINKDLLQPIATSLQFGAMNKFTSKAKTFIIICEEREKLITKVASSVKHLDYVGVDLGILTAHIVLAASSVGLSSCIIGWFNDNNIKRVLNLPKKKKIRLVVAIGYSNSENPRPKSRKDLDGIVKYYYF